MASAQSIDIPRTIRRHNSLSFTESRKTFRNQILATAIVSIGCFGTGNVFGWSAVSTDSILDRKDFGELSQEYVSWVTSIAILGAFFAGPVAGIFMNKLGRKKTIFIFTFPFILGWAIMSSAYFLKPGGFFLLCIGRFLTGVCVGIYLVIIPTYIKECSEDCMRGILGSALPLMLVCGILYTFILGSFLNWAVLSALCGAVPILLVVGMFIIPETPRYLLMRNRPVEAVKAFRWLNRADNFEAAAVKLRHEFSNLSLLASLHTADGATRFRNFFRCPVLLPLATALFVIFFQQFGGVNAVTLYTVEIFRGAGGFIEPHVATIIVGVVQVVFVVAAMILVDIAGRKCLITVSSCIMGTCLIGLGVFFFLKEKDDGSDEAIQWLPITAVLLYVASYSCGVGSVAWVLAVEIFNPDYRAESSAIMTCGYWMFGFVVAKTYITLEHGLQRSGCFWLYGAFCLIGALFSAVFVPETKGKSSQEILQHFGGVKRSERSTEESVSVYKAKLAESVLSVISSRQGHEGETSSDNKNQTESQ